MTQIIPLQKVFSYEGSQVRTAIKEDGTVYFVGKDVCEVLGITNHRDAIARLNPSLRDDVGIPDAMGRTQVMSVIKEAGVYRLAFTSRKPEAEAFSDWVAGEVLPSIRQTGSYDITQRRLPRNYVEALEDLLNTEKERVALAEQVALQAPKVEMYETLLGAKNAQSMGEVAKCFGWGRNKLFAQLRDRKVLMRNNLPYQQYLDADYFEVREVTTNRGDCRINVTQTLVTAKGLDFLGRLLNRAS